MATIVNVPIHSAASIVTNYSSTPSIVLKNLILPDPLSTLSRFVYLKEASEIPGPSIFSFQANSSFLQSTSFSSLYLNSNESLLLQAFSTSYWGILGGYNGTAVFSTQVIPTTSQIINPSLTASHVFVDLRTQSKTVVLPPIQTIAPTESAVPFYTIKDVYGNASVNPLYISTSGNNTLERSSINNSIALTQNYASIDLAANAFLKKWHILNYFDGNSAPIPPFGGGMGDRPIPTAPWVSTFISSSVIHVDTNKDEQNYIVLPAAEEFLGTPFYIRDSAGKASYDFPKNTPISILTKQGDFIDDTLNTLYIYENYQSVRLVPYSTTRYALTLNYKPNLSSFRDGPIILYSFIQRGPQRSWSAFAISSDGQVMLAVTNGGSSPGFYVSTDGGVTWPNYTSRSGNFSDCCMSSDGLKLYVCENGGFIYRSYNFGVNWEFIFSSQNWIAIDTSGDGGIVLAITADAVVISLESGDNPEDVSFVKPSGTTYTDCCVAAEGATAKFITVQGDGMLAGGDYIYRSTDKQGQTWNKLNTGFPVTGFGNWKSVTCDATGDIVYATEETYTAALFKSQDGGTNWSYSTTNPSGGAYGKIDTSSGDGKTLFVFDSALTLLDFTRNGTITFTSSPPTRNYVTRYALDATGNTILTAVQNDFLLVGTPSIQ